LEYKTPDNQRNRLIKSIQIFSEDRCGKIMLKRLYHKGKNQRSGFIFNKWFLVREKSGIQIVPDFFLKTEENISFHHQ